MSMMDSFVPQEDLLGEVSAGNGAAAVSPVATSPVVPPEFEDNENEEIKKICSENNGELNESESGVTYSAEPTISLTPSPSTEVHKMESGSSPESKKSLSPSRTPTKAVSKSPTSPRKVKSASPSTTKRVFSPENHRKRVSQFKLREMEKKRALDERRKKQAEELEKKKMAILKKHEAADRRLQQRSRASPVKSGAFGSTVRSRSSMSLNITAEKQKTGSVQNLSSPKVQLRPHSTTPRLKRPVSMGALPTSGPVHTVSLRKSVTPAPRSTKGTVSQPVIKQTKKDEDKKNTMKKKVDMKNLLKPTKVSNFTPSGRRTPEDSSKPNTKPRTSSMNRKSAATQSKPITAPSKTPAPKPRRSSVGKADARQHTPVESPTKSVMNTSMQAKVNQQEEAKLRLEEARKKAREERAIKEEEERRIAEEKRIEEERKRAEAEEARLRMLKEKELRKKQMEEDAERARIAEFEQAEQEQKEQEERIRAEQDRQESQQRDEQEALQLQRRKAEEERSAQEEERRERQKKLDAILKRSSVKLETAPSREISANASAILAKHNIKLNIPSATKQGKQDSQESSDDASNENNNTGEMNSNVDQISCDVEKEEFQPEQVTQDENLEKEISQEFIPQEVIPQEFIPQEVIPQEEETLVEETSEEIIREEEISEQNTPSSDNGVDQNVNDNILIDFSDDVDHSVSEGPTNNNNTLEELNNFNGDTRLAQDQDMLVMLSDEKPVNNEYIENHPDSASTKEANEFTIGITSPEELQLSNVL